MKKLLDSLREISKSAATCTRDLNEGDEPFDPEDDPVSLELFRFICEHRRVLDQLMAQHHTLRWSGSFYRCIAQTLRVQRAVLEVSAHVFTGQVKGWNVNGSTGSENGPRCEISVGTNEHCRGLEWTIGENARGDEHLCHCRLIMIEFEFFVLGMSLIAISPQWC